MESLGEAAKASASRRKKSPSWRPAAVARFAAAAMAGHRRSAMASHTEARIMKMPAFHR
jgi:hypothetical protein